MKKLFIIFLLVLCAAVHLPAQCYSIPEFAEGFFDHDRAYVEKGLRLFDMPFTLLPPETLRQFGYDADCTVAGVCNLNNVMCVAFLDGKGVVDRVRVNGVKYAYVKYIMSEYERAGYVLDEQRSDRTMLTYKKRSRDYYIIAKVNYLVNPHGCTTYTEFTKFIKGVKYTGSGYEEQPVDLNDYFNEYNGWGDTTDYNCTGFTTDEEYRAFKKELDRNGIYWSDDKNAWVIKVQRR